MQLRKPIFIVALAVATTFGGLGVAAAVTHDVTIVVDGQSVTVRTGVETVDELLTTQGVYVDAATTVAPTPDTAVTDGLHVDVSYSRQSSPAKYVELVADGYTHHFTTTATDVKALLALRGVGVRPTDRLNLELTAELSDGLRIIVQRVEVVTETTQEEIAFASNRQYTTNLAAGETQVVTPGVPGTRTATYQVTYVDGVEEARALLSDEVTAEPQTEQMNVGLGATGVISPGSAQDVARGLVAERGWDDTQFQCLVHLWTRESGWRVTAGNPISGAYGIPQALPGDKMAAFGDDWRTNAETQIKWGLHYIANRYGDPCGAWNFFLNNNWY